MQRPGGEFISQSLEATGSMVYAFPEIRNESGRASLADTVNLLGIS